MFTTGKIKSVYIFCVLATMLIAQDSSGKSGTTQKSLQQPAQKRNLENADDFNAVGDWRSISRPGYRAQPTPQSVEFYFPHQILRQEAHSNIRIHDDRIELRLPHHYIEVYLQFLIYFS